MTPSSHLSSNAIASGSSLVTSGHQQSRGRERYVSQACNTCRSRKTKCDGKKPACSSCMKFSGKCSYSKDAIPFRRSRNESYFEALKKHNEALESRCAELESLLEQCQKEHGGIGSKSDRSYLKRRPVDQTREVDDTSLDDAPDPTTNESDTVPLAGTRSTTSSAELDSLTVTNTNGPIQSLLAPMQRLSLEGGSLMAFGSTSVFRFRPVSFHNQSRFPAITENPKATYVLLVEGVHPSCFNPNFDWARHLPSEVNLTRSQHDKALDLLFKFCFSWCLRIVPGLFLRDMYRYLSVPRSYPPPKTPHYSPMLHNALVALSLSLLDEDALRDLKTRQYFANEAKKYIDTECAQPNLCTVNALSILGTYHSSQGEQTLGFMYFGMAARISQALGLDVDCSEWVASGLIEECDVLDRYWTFWTIFAQDVNWSLYVGRDFCVRAPTESDFKDMPVPFIDSEFDQMPFHHPPSRIDPQPSHLSKTFAFTCELLVIARRIMTVVNGLSKTGVGGSVMDEMISDIDLQLNAWKDSLPPEVDLTDKTRDTATPHRLMLHLAYWWFFILLHRPYFHRKPRVIHSSDKEIDHVKLCKRAAENIMKLIGVWHKLYGLRYTPINTIQPLFAAGTIYLLLGIRATSWARRSNKQLAESQTMLTHCMQYLREMAKSWPSASSLESCLQDLFEDRLRPAIDGRRGTGAATKAAAQVQHASDADRIYMTNPPARRASTKRLSSTRDRNGVASSTSLWHSNEHRGPTSSGASGSSPSGLSGPISSTSPLQTTAGLSSISATSPSSPAFLYETSPAGSLQPSSPPQSAASVVIGGNGFSVAPDTPGNFSGSAEMSSGEAESMLPTGLTYDYRSLDRVLYSSSAMLGGQDLLDVAMCQNLFYDNTNAAGTSSTGASANTSGFHEQDDWLPGMSNIQQQQGQHLPGDAPMNADGLYEGFSLDMANREPSFMTDNGDQQVDDEELQAWVYYLISQPGDVEPGAPYPIPLEDIHIPPS